MGAPGHQESFDGPAMRNNEACSIRCVIAVTGEPVKLTRRTGALRTGIPGSFPAGSQTPGGSEWGVPLRLREPRRGWRCAKPGRSYLISNTSRRQRRRAHSRTAGRTEALPPPSRPSLRDVKPICIPTSAPLGSPSLAPHQPAGS